MGAILEIDGAPADADAFLRTVVEPCAPVVLRGLVADWPVVGAANRGAAEARDYLGRFARDRPVDAFIGKPEIAGRYYYAEDLNGFNFQRRSMPLSAALTLIFENADKAGADTAYAGSLPVDDYLPGFTAENAMALLPRAAAPRIWLGHRSQVAAHYDAFDNLACVILGTRRFTLYPPALIGDLYVGPIDKTMAGQPVSLAASAEPGDPLYPRFAAVRDQALTVELAPGDALYIPKLWWHQIEADAPVNGLINYWWDAFSHGPDAPFTSLLLAMITIAERPAPERRAWRAFFDHYAFREGGHPLAHLPAEQHGLLGPLKDNYGRIRAHIMQMLRG